MLTLDHIRAAAGRLQGQILQTPCVESRTLSQITGCQVFLKFENLQYTASFKERGACNKLSQLSADERARGVVAMSAGNHAQGVAYHAQRLGLRAVIVMPRFTPGVKVERTRGFGAEVVLHGDTLDEARAHARALAQQQGLVFVHPYDDEAIVATVRKTNRVLVVHEDTRTGGIAGEITARINETCFAHLDAPVLRVTAHDIPLPYAPALEDFVLPQVDDIVLAVRRLVAW